MKIENNPNVCEVDWWLYCVSNIVNLRCDRIACSTFLNSEWNRQQSDTQQNRRLQLQLCTFSPIAEISIGFLLRLFSLRYKQRDGILLKAETSWNLCLRTLHSGSEICRRSRERKCEGEKARSIWARMHLRANKCTEFTGNRLHSGQIEMRACCMQPDVD